MSGSASKVVERFRYWCSLVSLGYCWDHRWNIKDGGEADCSSLLLYVYWEAGYLAEKPTWGNTDTLRKQLEPLGFVFKSSDKKKQPPGGVARLRTGHVAVSLGDGMVAQASINELGTVRGGKPGDQTGRETNISRDPNNWTWDIWPPDLIAGGASTTTKPVATTTTAKGKKVYNYGTLKKGSKGDAVKLLQIALNIRMNARLVVDGIFGAATDAALRAFQRACSLDPDGICGPLTWAEL